MSNLPAFQTGQSAVVARENVAAARVAAARQLSEAQASLAAAKAELEAQRKAMELAFRQREAELAALMKPLQAELARIQEVAFTIDLYLGRDEQVDLIADGEPAPSDTPIVIRQMVLAADEESLILVEEGGVDWTKMSAFVDWLTADPANRDRVIPDQRGVVVIVPSGHTRRTGDGLRDAAEADANNRAHWIIRNGERLYLLVTDPNLKVGPTILPRRDEFVSYFTDRAGELLEPGSQKWVTAQEAADARRRHYMRLMLVLQGLVDRSVCFAPLPEGGVNLLSLSAQDDGKVIILNELDRAIGDGRETFSQWQDRLNAGLRPGMRVILATGHPDWRDLYDSRHGEHSRLSPVKASSPPSGVPLLIEGRRDGGLIVRYERTDTIYKRNVPVPGRSGYVYRGEQPVDPSRRASARIKPIDRFVLPFDLATVDDLRYYLNHRGARKDYQNMVPTIKAALAAKEAEQTVEAPFRSWLAAQLVHEYDVPSEGVEATLAELVDWWKLAHKWARPLVGQDDPQVAKAAAAILREWRLRQKGTAGKAVTADQAVVSAARAAFGDDLLVVLHARSSGYQAYTKAGCAAWLHRHDLDRTGEVTSTREWTIIPPRTLATARVVWEAPEWSGWAKFPDINTMLTGPERDSIIAAVRKKLTADGHTPVLVLEVAERQEGSSFSGFAIKADADLTDLDAKNVTTNQTVRWSRVKGQVRVAMRPYWSSAEWQPERRRRDEQQAWADERLIAILTEREAAIKARERERRSQFAEAIPATTAGREALFAAWLVRREAAARARFDVDFPGADDLWEHHLSTLRLEKGWREPGWSWGFFNRLARAGVPFAGRSMADLAAIQATLHTGKPVDLGDFADLVLAPHTE